MDELVESEKGKLLERTFAVMYLLFIIGLLLAILLELKTAYQIDLFPGVDTPFDDVYRDAKNVLSGEPNQPAPPHD